MTKEEIIKKLRDMAKYPTVTLPRDTEALRNAADLLEQAQQVEQAQNQKAYEAGYTTGLMDASVKLYEQAQPKPCLYVKDIGGNFHLLKEKGHTENCMPLADDGRNHLPPSNSELVKKSLAQPEPVGYWMGEFNDGASTLYEVPQESVFGRTYRNIPIYTSPPPRQPLNLDELWRVFTRSGLSQFHQRDNVVEYKYQKCIEEFARAIETAVWEKQK